jgi:hypothetical protein
MRSTLQAALLALGATTAAPIGAVTLGQTDTFSASAEGWFAGGGPMGAVPPLPPSVQSSGGPGGASDAFLRISSNGGGGPGSRLVAMNRTQWAGDYLTAGVGAIEMDLINLGTTDVTMRLLFEDPTVGPPVNIAATSFGAFLPAGSGWMHVRFGITSDQLVEIAGDAAAALGGATLMRLYHSTTPIFPPVPLTAFVGVDNISAVPEPHAALSMVVGLALVGGVLHWRSKAPVDAAHVA